MLAALRQLREHARFEPVLRAQAADEWEALEGGWPAAAAPLPTAAIEWARAARTAFAEQHDLHALCVQRGGQIEAATAMIETRRHGAWRLCPPGHELGLPWDLTARDARSLQQLATALIRTGLPVQIDRLPAQSPTTRAIVRASRGRALAMLRPAAAYSAVPLSAAWEAPERYLPASARRRLDTARRHAERVGQSRTEIHTPDLHTLPRLLDLATGTTCPIAQQTTAGESLRLNRSVFLRLYAEAACIAGHLRICILSFGEQVAASHLAVEFGSALWILHSQANSRFAHCWPHELLACETLRYASQAQLASCANWCETRSGLEIWPLEPVECVSLAVYPLHLRGMVAAGCDAVRLTCRVIQTLGQRLPIHCRETSSSLAARKSPNPPTKPGVRRPAAT